MFAKKEAEEKALKDELAKKPDLQKLYLPAWEQIEKSYAELPKMANRLAFSNLAPSRLAIIAQHLLFSSWHNTGVHPGGHP